MWNEPVLAAVYDAVLDRGESNYQKTSVKGHRLTMWKPVPYAEEAEDNNTMGYEMMLRLWDNMVTLLNDAFRIDGKNSTLPTYEEVWFNNKTLK